MDKVRLIIDGVTVRAMPGATVLGTTQDAGIYIPTLCSRPDLPLPLGNCRLCVVQIEGRGFPSSCLTPVAQNMVVHTNTPLVQEIRRHFFKALLTPLPSPRLRRPALKKLADYIGVKEEELPPYVPRNLPVDRAGPLFDRDQNLCILCGLCVRVCQEVRGVKAIDFIARDGRLVVGPASGASLKEAGCRFCEACVEVCPTGALADRDSEAPFLEAALAPCTHACPAGIDVPLYVHLVGERRFAEAAAVVREKVPFPEVLSHVCFHPCEDKCLRGQVNEAIAILALKRVAVEREPREERPEGRVARPSGKRVAIVGSGPAGLAAGFYLTRLGHSVTVFEAQAKPGGMLQAGIPTYRLPREVLEEEISHVVSRGLELRLNSPVERPDALLAQGYDAVLLAAGLQQGRKLNIPGADLKGVLVGLSFLRQVNAGKRLKLGKKVLVLGGGGVACDVARVARRLGAEEVHMACLEARDTMPARPWEVEEAEAEGILIHPSLTFTRIVGNKGRVSGVECLKVKWMEFDKDGQLHLETVPGTEHVLEADTTIFAIGQALDPALVGDGSGLALTRRRTILANPETMETGRRGVFAAGEAVSGPASVVETIASARKAASSIDKYLGGSGVIDEQLVTREEPVSCLGPGDGFADLGRVPVPCLPLEKRWQATGPGRFSEVEHSYAEDAALAEAQRCLQCQLRFLIPKITQPPIKQAYPGEKHGKK